MHTIKMNRLKQIIREELEIIREGAEEEAAVKNSSACSKLKSEASEKTKSAAQELGLDKVEEKIKFIVGSPLGFIDPVAVEQPKSETSTEKLDSTPKKVVVKSQVKKSL
jgi:ABC-type Fe3+-citrate transport system substrate-binding protein